MPTNKNRRGRRRTRAAGTASIDGDIDGGGDGDLEAGITAEVATETSRLLPDTPTAAQRDSDIQPDLENGLRPGLAPSSLYGTPSVTPLARSRPASLRSFHAAAQHHRAGSPNSANAEAEAAPTIATPTGSNVTSSRRAAAKAKKNAAAAAAAKQQTTTTRRLRSKLLFALITLLLAVSVYASFVDDFMGDVEAAISCGTCIGLLLPLKALASVGDDAFVDFFVGWCTKLGIEDEDVCRGAVGTQAPILAHDLRSISLASHAAKNFCSTVFGLCPLQEVIPFEVKMKPPAFAIDSAEEARDEESALQMTGRWTARRGKKPPKQSNRPQSKWHSKGRKPFQVVHLSDVHIDRQYLPGSNTICSKVICCRDYGAIDSTGPAVTKPAGRFGNKHCDAPVDLVESMLSAIEEVVPNKSFTIFTGDVVESAVWAVNTENVSRDLHLWNKEMQAPAYPAFGNHDIAPVNAFPRSTTVIPPRTPSNSTSSNPIAISKAYSQALTDTQWVFNLAAHDWRKWIGDDAARSVREMYGCYSTVHPGTKLRIVSINTNYWYKQNFWLYDHDEPLWDPNGILTWLSNELHHAERLGQRVWIIGHMPFGKIDAMRDQSNYANQIFQRYHDTIAAHFYGHSHVDEFEIAYPNYNDRRSETANGIAYISGALTPASGNPVFRVYDIDPDTYEVMDFTPYYTNKSEPSFNINPVWKPYYSARNSYGQYLDPPLGPLDSLNGSFWHRVTEVFERNDTIFQLFNTRLSRGGKVESCSGHVCKNNTICMLRSMRSESNCAVIRPGLSFKDRKRDTEAVTEPVRDEGEEAFAQSKQHDYFECEGPGLGSMLRKVAQMSTGKEGEAPFANLMAFQAAAEAAATEHEKLRLGDGWIGPRSTSASSSASTWTQNIIDTTLARRIKRALFK